MPRCPRNGIARRQGPSRHQSSPKPPAGAKRLCGFQARLLAFLFMQCEQFKERADTKRRNLARHPRHKIDAHLPPIAWMNSGNVDDSPIAR